MDCVSYLKKCDGLNMDCVSYLKKCDGLNMDCVSYLKDCIRVRGHLRIDDTTNNARLEEQSTSVSTLAMLSEIT